MTPFCKCCPRFSVQAADKHQSVVPLYVQDEAFRRDSYEAICFSALHKPTFIAVLPSPALGFGGIAVGVLVVVGGCDVT